jgi:hypothetical protein
MLLAGAAAVAQAEHFTASIAQPLSEHKELIANGNIFRCSTTTCVLTSEPRDPGSIRTCRELKRQVGPLTAYGSGTHVFDAAKLTKCNES